MVWVAGVVRRDVIERLVRYSMVERFRVLCQFMVERYLAIDWSVCFSRCVTVGSLISELYFLLALADANAASGELRSLQS